jgi:hypothetical protein
MTQNSQRFPHIVFVATKFTFNYLCVNYYTDWQGFVLVLIFLLTKTENIKIIQANFFPFCLMWVRSSRWQTGNSTSEGQTFSRDSRSYEISLKLLTVHNNVDVTRNTKALSSVLNNVVILGRVETFILYIKSLSCIRTISCLLYLRLWKICTFKSESNVACWPAIYSVEIRTLRNYIFMTSDNFLYAYIK